MKTVGQILGDERKKQNKSLSEIYQSTKIPISALKKIELDQFSSLPMATFTKGFLKNYAECLSMDSVKILAIFRRDFIETKKGRILPKELSHDISKTGFGINPRTLSKLGVGFLLALVMVYFALQLKTIVLPPKISINEIPSVVINEDITIQGKVDREAVVTINDDLILLDDNKFSHTIKLENGTNKIELKAIDRRKKESSIILEIKLDKEG